jgi:hypothetical protein
VAVPAGAVDFDITMLLLAFTAAIPCALEALLVLGPAAIADAATATCLAAVPVAF